MEQLRDSIDFGKEDIGRLFFKLLFPTLTGLLFSAMFNLVDGVFVGRGVGSDALASVNVAAPIFMICTTFALLFGTGVSVVAAIHLSHGNLKAANINMTQAFTVGTLLAVLIAAFGILFPEATGRLCGGSPLLQPWVTTYLWSALPGLPFCIILIIGLFVLRLDGSPRFAMTANVIAAVLNIFLDWLFVFPLHWGIGGAGFATTISEAVGASMVIYYMFCRSNTLHFYRPKFTRKSLTLTLRNVGYMARTGLSSALGELAISCLMIVGNHRFMALLHEDGVAAFSVACYLIPLILMVGNAVAQSALPILSYNYGLKRTDRIRKTLRLSLSMAALAGLALSIVGVTCSQFIVTLFLEPGQPSYAIACEGFKWFATGFMFLSLNLVMIGYYQSIERSNVATLFMLLRGFIILVPTFYILPHFLNATGLWLTVPVSEVTTLLIIVIYALASK